MLVNVCKGRRVAYTIFAGAEGMARAGNYSVVICFMGALAVNSLYFDGSEVATFVLAPIFLLLETRNTFLEVFTLNAILYQ